jgi:hypothetical protein
MREAIYKTNVTFLLFEMTIDKIVVLDEVNN